MEKIPASGEVYRDFTGRVYRVVTTAEHAETGEKFVVYQALDGEFGIFVLPLAGFTGEKADGEKRFTLIPSPKILCSGDPKTEGSSAGTDSSRKSGLAESSLKESDLNEKNPAEGGLDAGLLAFLEAESYEEKLKVYSSLAGRVDGHMLNTIAVSMDLELSGGSIEEQYDNLKSCLLTLERYECSRLR